MKVESYRVVGRCRVRKGGRPGSWIFTVLMQWSHADMDLSDWSHMVWLICACLRNDVNCGRCLVLTECRIYVCRLILRMLCILVIRQGFCSSDVCVGKKVTKNDFFL